MTRIFLLFAVAAFPLALNATTLNSVGSEGAAQHSKSHQQDGANPSIHDHCSCPADCPCRTEQHEACDCGCECSNHQQHE
jgi:hypothetical protein